MHGGNSPKYVILGAGITGLALAYFLKKASPKAEITLLEKASKASGWIQTHQTFGYLFEAGPHMLRLQPPYRDTLLELIEDLNLHDQVIRPHQSFKTRLLAYHQKLHPLKISPSILLHPSNLSKITYPLLKNFFSSTAPITDDHSIQDFFQSTFGQYITRYFIDPMIMGIHGGLIQNLSFQSCFPSLYQINQAKTPLLRAILKQKRKSSTEYISFQNGLQTLPRALEKTLACPIHFKTEALKVEQKEDSLLIHTAHETFSCDHVFSSIPSYALAQLIRPHAFKSISFLENQKHVSYKLIHLGYDATLDLPQAFGFITPSWSDIQISGVIFDSIIFPQQNFQEHQTRLTVMIHEDSELYPLTGKAFDKAFFEELHQLLNIHVSPQYYEVFNLNRAIPQYAVGHKTEMEKFKTEMKEKLPNFTFCGSSFDGASVPACIYSAANMAALFNQADGLKQHQEQLAADNKV